MKKIGIISDTHNLLRPEITEILKTCDCVVHAGDVCRPEILDQIRWYGNLYVARGNNDTYWANALAQVIHFEIEGVKFVMAHRKGDAAIVAGDAQVVIYGHTHKYAEKTEGGKLWLNPGSCGPKRFGGNATMAVMTVDGSSYSVKKIEIE